MNRLHAKLQQVVLFLFLIWGCTLVQAVEVKAFTDDVLLDPTPLLEELDSSKPELNGEVPYTDNTLEIIEPTIDKVEGEVETAQTVIDETAEPLIRATAPIIQEADTIERATVPVEQIEPILQTVNSVVQQPVVVDETTVVPILDRIGDGVQVILDLHEVDTTPILDPIPDRLVPLKPHHNESRSKDVPLPVRRQQPNIPAVIATQYGYSINTGPSASDYSGGSPSNLMTGTRDGEYMLTRMIIVTRNYANEFILYDQWSHAPPGQPPKQFLLNLIMDYKS